MPEQPAFRRIDTAIGSGRYHVRVHAPGSDGAERPLTCHDDLSLRVCIAELGQTTGVDLAPLFLHFLDSGQIQGNYADDACITIEKFGAPLQFKETIRISFRRT